MARAVEHESSVGILGSVLYFTARHTALRFELAQGLEGIKHARHRGGFDVDGARRDAQLIALLALGLIRLRQLDMHGTRSPFVEGQGRKCRCPLLAQPLAVFPLRRGHQSQGSTHLHCSTDLHIRSRSWNQLYGISR